LTALLVGVVKLGMGVGYDVSVASGFEVYDGAYHAAVAVDVDSGYGGHIITCLNGF